MSGKRNLSEWEIGILTVLFIADGKWDKLDLNEEQAQNLVHRLFGCFGENDTIKAVYLSLQNALMARRKDTFEEIQEEPPFSRRGQRTLTRLFEAWKDAGEQGLTECWNIVFCDGSCLEEEPRRLVRVEADTGICTMSTGGRGRWSFR
jgi:hypothetical protein